MSDQPADYDVIVVGAGVLGTFHTHFAIRRGLRVLFIERTALPDQASVRNFGLVIPSAMASGIWKTRGRRSVEIYRELSTELGFELQQGGTQYLASTDAEAAVLQEAAALRGVSAGCEFFLSRGGTDRRSACHARYSRLDCSRRRRSTCGR